MAWSVLPKNKKGDQPPPKRRYNPVDKLESQLKTLGIELMTAFGQTLMDQYGFTQEEAQEAVKESFDRAKANRAVNHPAIPPTK